MAFPDTIEEKPKGCFAVWGTVFLLVFCILPWQCVKKVRHKVRTAATSLQLQESDIAFVVLLETYSPAREVARGHLSRRVATLSDGRQELYAVEPGHQARYVWIDDGRRHTPVYGVFSTPAQVQSWAEANGYEGDFEFSLFQLNEERPAPESMTPFAKAHMPHYERIDSVLEVVIFTKGARYGVFDGDVYEMTPDNELYRIYGSLAR